MARIDTGGRECSALYAKVLSCVCVTCDERCAVRSDMWWTVSCCCVRQFSQRVLLLLLLCALTCCLSLDGSRPCLWAVLSEELLGAKLNCSAFL